MARMLDAFPENLQSRDGKYPWSGPEGWANGNVWELEEGVDFDTKINSFRQTAAKVAHRQEHLKSPRTAVRIDGKKKFLVIQFFPNNDNQQPGRRRAKRT